ncbi:MAG: serine hydrolase [Methanobacterium sp.]|nr:MAG: serine hydrolase [Methanobacterium sp.]
MDVRIVGGVVLVCVIVVVAGVLFYSNDFKTSEGNNNNTLNISDNNTTNTSTNQMALTLIGDNQQVNTNPSPNPNPNPGPGPTPPKPTPDPMDHILSLFNSYLTSNYNQSLIPGMAVAIVEDGKIIYMKTLGVKDLTSGEKIDKNTLFGIGSNTKSFTAINVGQLVSAGLMSWDDPLSKFFSPLDFELYSDYVTSNITIRDAFLHRSGLPSLDGDLVWAGFNQPYVDYILGKLRYRENNTEFRSTFQYNNLIYVLPGYATEKVTNLTWNEFFKINLLEKLGMNTATTSYYEFLNSSNHVTPYYLLSNGTMLPFEVNPDSVAPAGGLFVSINEMTNWLKFQINGTGYYNRVKILNKTEFDETHKGQMYINDFYKYGLGWNVANDNSVIKHSGAIDAFRSQVTLYPSKVLGIVIITNGGDYGGAFRDALNSKFTDLVNGNETSDPWPVLKNKTAESLKPVPAPGGAATLSLNQLIGVYSNQFYGNINVTVSNSTLFGYFGVNPRPFELVHWDNDTYKDPVLGNYLSFDNDTGNVTLTLKLSEGDEKATFNRTNIT